jgi:FAD/FMN-containing dehydrogenase
MTLSWQNWSGGVRCSPRKIATPADERTLARLLRQSEGPIRVAGNGHSFTPLCATDGILVSLAGLSGIVEADSGAGTATIWAGTRLSEAGEPLLGAGLALENMGDIDQQALGGAVGTGTHGTGPSLGSFSTQVISLRIALASGQLVDCSQTLKPELLAAARLGLGALGIVTRITLRMLPAYRLHERTWVVPFDQCLEELDERITATRHFEFFWSPRDDACAAKALDPTTAPVGVIAPALAASGRLPRYLSPERVDWSYRIFPSERTVRFNEMEFAVPAEVGPACVREIRTLMLTKYPDVEWPIEYRTLRADDVPLSPAFERPSVTISIHQAADLPHQAFFSDAEAIFRSFLGRPHWGKMHSHTARQLQQLYPRFNEFVAVRDRVDPSGRFLNDHLRKLFIS